MSEYDYAIEVLKGALSLEKSDRKIYKVIIDKGGVHSEYKQRNVQRITQLESAIKRLKEL